MKLKGMMAIPILVLSLVSCRDNEVEPEAILENEVNAFVWGALNSWYYWQQEVAELSDDKFESIASRNTFLNGFEDPVSLFEALRHPEDRFSWIVDDYVALNEQFQGITYSFGFEFGLVRFNDQVLAYVEYVIPGTPAESAGLVRGDIIGAVNGVELNLDNYVDLLFRQESFDLSLVSIENDQVIARGVDVSVGSDIIRENPVLLAEVIDYPGAPGPVGYLVYNGFTHTYHSELNQAFQTFASAGVTDLIIDLRYNPGGSVLTCQILASMIYSQGLNSDLFTLLEYNSKHSQFDRGFPFTDFVSVRDGDFNEIGREDMNRLNISQVYFITGTGTASASELLINGLEPYMPVKIIGDTTRGKNEGSITLYDSPATDYTSEAGANPAHTWALQPIVFRLVNAEGFGDYATGLLPSIPLEEQNFFFDLKPLGDPEEILLKTALEDIAGVLSTARIALPEMAVEHITDSRTYRQIHSGLYLNGY
jgi:C-terminal processing protease CtpA/Prc